MLKKTEKKAVTKKAAISHKQGHTLFEGTVLEAIRAGVSLAGANLSGLNLSGQDLSGANFTECDLRGANFSGCTLERVNFNDADLSGAAIDRNALVNCSTDRTIWPA